MKLSKTRIGLIASTITVAAFALIFTLAVPQTADAYSRGPGGFWGQGAAAKGVVNDTYLLEELGVSAEEYAAAQEAVNEAALQAAVDAGLITQERADAIKELAGDRGFGKFGMMGKFGRGGFGDFHGKRGGFQGRGFGPGTSPDNTTTPSSLSF